MGGLISRYFIEQLGGDRMVRNLVTVGTPHDGAPEGLRVPTNLPSLARFLLPQDIVTMLVLPIAASPIALALPTLYLFATTFLRGLQSVVLHFNSLYQLLPNAPFVYPNATASAFEPLADSFNALKRQSCSSGATSPLICTKPIGDLRRLNTLLQGRARSIPSNVTYHCVVSHNHPTTTACRRDRGGELQAIQRQCGDGTVPAASAMLPPASNVLNRFVAATWAHSDLLHERSVLEFAFNVARGQSTAPVTGIRDAPPPCASSGTTVSFARRPPISVAA